MPAVIRFLGYNPTPPGDDWGERLVQCRTALGLSQKQSAERLGVDPSTLARWERGERVPVGEFGEDVMRLFHKGEDCSVIVRNISELFTLPYNAHGQRGHSARLTKRIANGVDRLYLDHDINATKGASAESPFRTPFAGPIMRVMLEAEMTVFASFGDDPEKVAVILPLGDPQVMLADVATKPSFQLFGMALSYSYPDEELSKRLAQPANTMIEMAVPYCFHVPDNAMFELKQDGAISHLVFRKVWTKDAAGSSNADYRSPTHVLYHNSTTVQTPKFPTDPSLGPDPICMGLNVEAGKDRSGLYRYSLIWMFLSTAYTREMLTSQAGAETARSDMISRGVAAINRFIDVYRTVTKSAHVQRLAGVHVRNIFFQEHNIGFHGASFGHGIGTAVMNRSEGELDEISRISATGEDIATWDLLFLDAEASLNSNSFTLAVVNAFQALELRLEDFLEKRMAGQGVQPGEIEKQLDRIWRTKQRLKDVVPFLVGRRLIDDDPRLWDRFCWAYDDIRNKLIHTARDLDREKAERAISACRDVGAWLDRVA